MNENQKICIVSIIKCKPSNNLITYDFNYLL